MQSKDRIVTMFGLGLIACLLVLSVELGPYVFSIIQDNQSFEQPPLFVTCLLAFLIAIVPLLWFPRLSPVYILLSICAYIAAVILLVFAAAYLLQIWVPPTALVLAILLSYPLWNYRKLSVAQASLDNALQNLQDELAKLGMEQVVETPYFGENPQQARIRKLALTAKHLRNMHKSRSDTLVFISHDIRTPLGTAMLLLEKFERNKYAERMARLLERAHTMAEGFLQASRAEMTDVNKFQVLDMVSLAQQAIDDIYELLNAKNISVEMDFPEDNVWVRGDFGLLFRAVSNILLNAVNYSPVSSIIKVAIDKDAVMLRLRVVDQGPGIPEGKIQKLFKRFSRVDGEYQDQDGSGLGLYFVGVTVSKHRGTVSVENVDKQGAEFVITLPLERRRNNIPVAFDRRAKPQSAYDDTI